MNFFLAIQAILAILLILCIMLQHRAAGLSAQGSGMNTTIVQRRGAEKLLYQATYVLAIAFFALTILQWYV